MADSMPRAPSAPLSARELIDLVVDQGSFRPWEGVIQKNQFKSNVSRQDWPSELGRGDGTSESVITGSARLAGEPLVVIVGEFAILGGSIGATAGERVARAFDRALESSLPVVALPCSGGMRIQEGTRAFLQMAKMAQAVGRYRRAGLPFVVYLTNPTYGGVLASWGGLGHVTFAMPNARIGLTGPRVVEIAIGERLPEDVQTAENLVRCGLIDDVVPPDQIRKRVAKALAVAGPSRVPDLLPSTPDNSRISGPSDAWASVCRSREVSRSTSADLLSFCASNVTILRGDGTGGGDDSSCVAAFAKVSGVPAVVIAHDRARTGRGIWISPAGCRKARRAIALASELKLPLVSVIDTSGARLDQESEESGLSLQLANCLMEFLSCPSPTMSVLLGEGAGGGAMALFPADRVLSAEHGWLAPIHPEAASAILYRSSDRAPDLARRQDISASDLQAEGTVDLIIQEEGHPQPFLRRMSAAIGRALHLLLQEDEDERLNARAKRYRHVAGGGESPLNGLPKRAGRVSPEGGSASC